MAYKEAADLLKCRLNWAEPLLFAGRLKPETFQEYYLTKEQEELLAKALEYGNSRKTAEVLKEIF